MATPRDTPTPGDVGSGEAETQRRVSSLPRVTSEEIRNRGFKRATRGVSEAEVRNFLHRIADELDASRGRERELERQVANLEDTLRNPPPVTEEQLLDSLGDETARVLRAAQSAANEIRSKAETLASTVVEEAENTARELRKDADAFVADRRQEGEALATRLRDEAEARGRELREEAERLATEIREHAEAEAAEAVEQAREQGRTMVNQAKLVRERVLTDLTRRRSSLRTQLQELRSGRERLLEGYRVVRRTLGEATVALGGPPQSAPDLDLEALTADEPEATDAELEAVLAEAEKTSDASLPEAAGAGDLAVSSPASEVAEPGVQEADSVPDAAALPPGRGLRTYVKEALGFGGEQGEPVGASVDDEANTNEGEVPEPAGREEPTGIGAPTDRPDAGAVFAKLRAERTATESEDADEELADAPSRDGEPPPSAPAEPLEGDAALLAARDEALAPIETTMARAVKRALQDEQNELLDSLRRTKRRKDVSVLVRDLDDVVGSWAETIRAGVEMAYGSAPPDELLTELATTLVAPLHDRVGTAVAEGGDTEELTQRVGARYREWRNQELSPGVAEIAATAHSRAVFDMTAENTRLRWVPSRPGKCPDCDDNALEPTVRGKPFPTGQVHPPAHPSCRCLLVAEP